MIFMDGKARWWVVKGTMQQFAEVPSSLLGRPVADATGLTGQYDYQLTWTMDMAGPGTPPASDDANALPMLPTAIQQQLGLRLEGKKVTLEMVVVDHMEKTPSKN